MRSRRSGRTPARIRDDPTAKRCRGALQAHPTWQPTSSPAARRRPPHPPQSRTARLQQNRRPRLITESSEQTVPRPVAADLRVRRQPRSLHDTVVTGEQRPSGFTPPRADRDVSEVAMRHVGQHRIDAGVEQGEPSRVRTEQPTQVIHPCHRRRGRLQPRIPDRDGRPVIGRVHLTVHQPTSQHELRVPAQDIRAFGCVRYQPRTQTPGCQRAGDNRGQHVEVLAGRAADDRIHQLHVTFPGERMSLPAAGWPGRKTGSVGSLGRTSARSVLRVARVGDEPSARPLSAAATALLPVERQPRGLNGLSSAGRNHFTRPIRPSSRDCLALTISSLPINDHGTARNWEYRPRVRPHVPTCGPTRG